MKAFRKNIWKFLLVLTATVMAISLIFILIRGHKVLYAHIEHNNSIGLTPAEIQRIRDIGEWEFLSLPTEELVDTIRKGFFMDDRLVRIYYGTLRLGINLQETSDNWIHTQGDTVSVLLPAIRLLDKDFINEAQTKAFYESGTWSESAKQTLYYKAYNAMKRRCLTKENLKIAEDNARNQLSSFFRAFGFNHTIVSFQDE